MASGIGSEYFVVVFFMFLFGCTLSVFIFKTIRDRDMDKLVKLCEMFLFYFYFILFLLSVVVVCVS